MVPALMHLTLPRTQTTKQVTIVQGSCAMMGDALETQSRALDETGESFWKK